RSLRSQRDRRRLEPWPGRGGARGHPSRRPPSLFGRGRGPQDEGGAGGASRRAPYSASHKSCQLDEPQRGVLEWLRAFALITVTKICSIGVQIGSSVFTPRTKSP